MADDRRRRYVRRSVFVGSLELAGGIVLSGSHSQSEGTAIGTAIGTLSVNRAVLGTYTFTETADPDGVFTLTGAIVKNGALFNYDTATSHSVSYQGTSDNAADPVLTATFIITVINEADFLLLADGASFLLLANGTDRLLLAGPPF